MLRCLCSWTRSQLHTTPHFTPSFFPPPQCQVEGKHITFQTSNKQSLPPHKNTSISPLYYSFSSNTRINLCPFPFEYFCNMNMNSMVRVLQMTRAPLTLLRCTPLRSSIESGHVVQLFEMLTFHFTVAPPSDQSV